MKKIHNYYEDYGEADKNESFKPCPFCGSTRIEVDSEVEGTCFFVRCHYCEARTGIYERRKQAVAEWNYRKGAKEDTNDAV